MTEIRLVSSVLAPDSIARTIESGASSPAVVEAVVGKREWEWEEVA